MFQDHNYPTTTQDVGEFHKEFLEPSFSDLAQINILVAYFSVQGFSEIFRGLQNIFKNNGKVSLIIGLNNRPDREILEAGSIEITKEEIDTFDKTFIEDLGNLKDLGDKYRIALFAFLIKKDFLEVKFAKMIDRYADFHPKVYILKDLNGDYVSSTGSTNLTYRGTRSNFEMDSIRVSWEQGRDSKGVKDTIKTFNEAWSGKKDTFVIHDLNEEFAAQILDKLEIIDSDEEFLRIIEYLDSEGQNTDKLYEALNNSPILSEFSLGNVALWPHQASVFQKAINMWPIRQLFSDEVGLGKTLEVGAVASYLKRYKNVSRILILPPAGLVENWQEEMRERFGLEFEKYDLVKKGWTDYDNNLTESKSLTKPYRYSYDIPKLAIISQDLVGKTEDHFFIDVKEFPELVIVDEAHHVRKTRERNGTEPRKLYKFIESIKDEVPHILLATATPMSKQVEEYYFLLDILGIHQFVNEKDFKNVLKFLADEGAGGNLNFIKDLANIFIKLKRSINENNFSTRPETLKELNQINEDSIKNISFLQNTKLEKALLNFFTYNTPASFYTSRNMRSVLEKFPDTYKFPKRIMHGELVEIEIGSDIPNLLNRLLDFVQTDLGKTEEIRFERKNVSGLVKSFYQQRFWSSFFAARKSLNNRHRALDEHLEDMKGTGGRYVFDTEEGVSVFIEDDEGKISKEHRNKIIRAAEYEKEALHDITQLFDKVIPRKDEELALFDPKIMALSKILNQEIAKNRPVIIFSRYTDTLEFIEKTFHNTLNEELNSYIVFTGDRREHVEKDRISSKLTRKKIRELLDGGKIQILLCSEAASEGLNLQSASIMVNIDVPWVPTRLEQRIGRIDRLGQKEDEIDIYNIYYPETYEQEMYDKLFRRQIDINFTLGPFASIMSDDIRQTLHIEDLRQFEEVTTKYNALKTEESFKGLQKLWEEGSKINEYSESVRSSILRFIQKDNPETVLEAISGTLKPVTLANEELKYAIKNEFQLDLFKDYSFVIANNSIWGMTKKIDNKSFLINPDKILNVLFEQYLEEYLFDEVNSELSLKQIIEIYVEKETVLSIPKHYYFTSQELEENKFYDENIKLVLLEEYI
jgi:SNF2 family DNA or RNA helicase